MSAFHNKPNETAAADSEVAASSSSSGESRNGARHQPRKGTAPAPTPEQSEVVNRILSALSGLDYGSVEIVVQDYRIVQIERTQRSRFPKPLNIPQSH